MSETNEKPARSMEDLNQEYSSLCGQLGDAQFKLTQLNSVAQSLLKRIAELTVEAEKLKAADESK